MESEQNKYFEQGKTKVQWPDSKHNKKPSWALDAAPTPIDWEDRERFYYFAGVVMAVAKLLKIEIRWGGDWDRDGNFKDQSFDDLVHFEMVTDETNLTPRKWGQP